MGRLQGFPPNKSVAMTTYLESLIKIIPGIVGFSGGSVVKESACSAGDTDVGSVPGSERSPGEENGNPLQYSCLENFMDRGAWQPIVHRVIKSQARWK